MKSYLIILSKKSIFLKLESEIKPIPRDAVKNLCPSGN
jgi:hypothetical protein